MNRKLADESSTGDEYLIGIKVYFSLVKIGVTKLFYSRRNSNLDGIKNIFRNITDTIFVYILMTTKNFRS